MEALKAAAVEWANTNELGLESNIDQINADIFHELCQVPLEEYLRAKDRTAFSRVRVKAVRELISLFNSPDSKLDMALLMSPPRLENKSLIQFVAEQQQQYAGDDLANFAKPLSDHFKALHAELEQQVWNRSTLPDDSEVQRTCLELLDYQQKLALELQGYRRELDQASVDINNPNQQKAAQDKIDQLETKLKALSEFLSSTCKSEQEGNLTKETLSSLMNTFEQADVNRGTGFYRWKTLSIFGQSKRYKDDSNTRRLVKSTLGERVYDFAKAYQNSLDKAATQKQNM